MIQLRYSWKTDKALVLNKDNSIIKVENAIDLCFNYVQKQADKLLTFSEKDVNEEDVAENAERIDSDVD